MIGGMLFAQVCNMIFAVRQTFHKNTTIIFKNFHIVCLVLEVLELHICKDLFSWCFIIELSIPGDFLKKQAGYQVVLDSLACFYQFHKTPFN